MTAKHSDRLLRGYGPLLGFAAIFLAIALLVPTQRQEIRTETVAAASQKTSSGDTAVDTEVAGETTIDPTTVDPSAAGAAASSGAQTAAGNTAAKSGTTKGGATGSAGVTGTKATGGVAACADRAVQIPGDPYSPPCYTFSGDNGGATSKGVTKDSIVVSLRIQAFDNGLADALTRLAKSSQLPNESRDLIARTLQGLVDYINKTFQMYGRKIDLKIYTGQGKVEDEILGAGQEGAEGDAIKVADEFGAFADASAVTPPYSDALFRRKVINVGAPYMSREWLSARRPYVWSPLTDCSTVVESAASYYLSKMAGKPASLAGGALKGQPRRTAVIAPDNSWYQECVKAGVKTVVDGGHGAEIVDQLQYRLAIDQMAPQATNLISKLKTDNITTVLCGCDPLILSFLTGKAREQGYQPEWVETGVALTDQDLVAEIFDPTAWNHAFGVSFSGPSQAVQAGPGYRAFKAIHPNEEPSVAADLMYYQLELLAIGIQMAGPNLKPETFEQGMFRYPQTSGPMGTWKFGPNDYSTSQDAREVYWDSNARSPQTNETGAWIDPNGGKRYPIGGFPAGEPNVPK